MPTGYTPPFFIQTFHLPSGLPASGGKLYFFVGGSTTLPKNVYADINKTVPMIQPLVLDAGGTAPQYFFEDGLYKVMLYDQFDVLLQSRDNIQGAGGGTGGEGDAFTVKASPLDPSPATLIEKVQNTQTVTWGADYFGGVNRIFATVNAANVLDYKVKTDGADPIPGYLGAKFENGHYIDYTVNLTNHKIRFDFTGPDYVPKTGGAFTGPVTIPTLTSTTVNTGALNVTNNAIIGGTTTTGVINAGSGSITNLIAGNMVVSGLSGSNNNVVMVNSSGQLYKVYDPLYKVKISSGDPVAGYLSTKIYAGSGIQITTSNDSLNGDNINISLIDIPVPLALPAGQVGYGNGTGVTSSSRLTYTQPGTAAATLLVDKSEIDTYFVGGRQYTSWANISANATNFRDAINQRDDGVICIGGGGDSGAIKLTPSTRAVDFGIFSTVTVGGKLIPPGTTESGTTAFVPELLPGEIRIIRFVNASGTTLISNSTQKTFYRSSTTGVSSIANASAQVDGSGVFGKSGTGKIAAVTFIGVDSTTIQAVF